MASRLRGAGAGSLRIGVRRLVPDGVSLPAVSGLPSRRLIDLQWSGAESSVLYVLRGDLTAFASNGSIVNAAFLADVVHTATQADGDARALGSGFY